MTPRNAFQLPRRPCDDYAAACFRRLNETATARPSPPLPPTASTWRCCRYTAHTPS